MPLILIFVTSLFFSSCYNEANKEYTEDLVDEETSRANEIWICYHPDTKFHDEVCVEEYFPNGCYVKGDRSRFCWKLTSQDCDNGSISLQWPKHCDFLQK